MKLNQKLKILSLIYLLAGCFQLQAGTDKKNKKKNLRTSKKTTLFQPVFGQPPSAIVYKTKADYKNNVPLSLNEEKSEIQSYFHPTDLTEKDKFLIPIPLSKNYVLDRQGIHKNSVFLKYNYKYYSQLKNSPKLDTLLINILDKNPFLEIWDCGCRNRYTNIKSQLNEIIFADSLTTKCKPIYLSIQKN